MLTIRLQRTGRTHEPTYRIVLTDSKFGPKSGKAVEVLGAYDSRPNKGTNKVDGERVKYWISKGAQLSDTMHNFLVEQKVISGKKINVLPKNKILNVIRAKEAEEKAKAEAEAAKAQADKKAAEEAAAAAKKAEEEAAAAAQATETPAPEAAPEIAPETPVEEPAQA